ncbi:hypothetical protein EDD18DRAFT_1184387 [Armillaria luteobubalina]|uniref:Uncharacterized protein n=1 Tax=Armillaria luteobubalina TaxID=153913 RepID=A0AA39UTN7_9AGAR|nr:hypothetical protein EDD18DRAFT_1184387 [Armillaria luteobubalina]
MAEAAPFYPSGCVDEADHESLSNDDTTLHETDETESSLTSDGEGEDVEEDEEEEDDVGLQAALAASKLDMEDTLRQEELELQRAIEASQDVEQDAKFELDTERAIEMSLSQERDFDEMRIVQERLCHSDAGSSSDTPVGRPSSPSSVSTISAGSTSSRSRHHPFLSPPASIIFSADESGPSRFSSLGAVLPIDSDAGSTATEIDISAYPLLPDSPSAASSVDFQLPDGRDDDAYGFGDCQRTFSLTTSPQSSSSPPSLLPSRVCASVFHTEDSIPFPEAPAHTNAQYQRDTLPRGMQTIPITVLGGTEPVNIPVLAGDPHRRASNPRPRATLLSPSPTSAASDIEDVPFPEVEPRAKRVPATQKRCHERAFSTRSAHMTCVPSSTSPSIQEEQRVGGSDDTDPSLFRRLAVPPAVVSPKTPPLKMPSRNFLASDLLADVEPQMSLQLFRTTTRPLFSDQCLCISCDTIFVHNLQQSSKSTTPHGSLTCYCESCGVEFCHGCRRPPDQCEEPETCRPRIATAIFRILSLIDVELLRVGGPERVNDLFAKSAKRQCIANALSAMVALLNNSTHKQHCYLPHLINLSLVPVIFEYLLGRPPRLWIETRITEDLYNQMLTFLMISFDVGRGEILLQQRGRIVEHRGLYEMMQDTRGITWDNVAPLRSLADIIEGIYGGEFMKEAVDYISRGRYLFDHLSEHVNHVKHLFEGVDRLRMMDDSGKAVISRRSNIDVVL